jgi:hypothetical protein
VCDDGCCCRHGSKWCCKSFSDGSRGE